MGQFPATMLATMRAAANRGQRTVPEMIDGHQVRDPQVRDLLTGYVARRSADLDYPSAEALAYRLGAGGWQVEVAEVGFWHRAVEADRLVGDGQR